MIYLHSILRILDKMKRVLRLQLKEVTMAMILVQVLNIIAIVHAIIDEEVQRGISSERIIIGQFQPQIML